MMTDGTSIYTILKSINAFIGNRIMPILVAIAVLVFLGNMIYFLANMGNEQLRGKWRNYMINSLLALFILISIWGIVGIGTRTFFGTRPFIPQLPTSGE